MPDYDRVGTYGQIITSVSARIARNQEWARMNGSVPVAEEISRDQAVLKRAFAHMAEELGYIEETRE